MPSTDTSRPQGAEQLIDDQKPGYLTASNVAAYRQALGIDTPDQLHRVMALRDQLAGAYNELLELVTDPEGDFGELLDGIEAGIETLDTIITPTGDAIAELLFIDPDDDEEDDDDLED